MARRYAVGEGVPQDKGKGRDLAVQALKQGRAGARFMLATLFGLKLDEIDRLIAA
jgi:hypothetical protein